jgi:hypothetical protein
MPVLDFFSIFLNYLTFFSFNFYMVQKDVSFGLKNFFLTLLATGFKSFSDFICSV